MRVLSCLFLCWSIQGQTRVDLRNQSKQVDFTTAISTRPLKLGTILPPTCTTGELFFNSGAPAGSNLYGCAATNTWILEGVGSAAGTGAILAKLDGVAVGSRATVNFVTGQGLVNIFTDDGTQINIQQAIDSSFVETRPLQQAGTTLLCLSQSGSSSSYTCSMTPALAAYATGMVVHWIPDQNGAGGATTLSIDGAGVRGVKLIDGSDPTAADIIAGRQYDLWFDGANLRLKSPIALPVATAIPACSATLRGRIWLTPGATGAKDSVSVCAKDASETYAWRALY